MSMSVNASVMKSLEESVKSMIIEAVTRCSQEYDFDLSEALKMLELSTLKVVVKEKVVKEKTKKVVSKKIPLPFIEVNADRCYCLLKNYGLYTQCENLPVESEEYCLKCEKKENKLNACERDELILMKKIKVTPYIKIMEKFNSSMNNIVI
jgi:tRNA(Met) C34 N-acetyltransferase TmcA